jgi:hypothetical protein
MRFGFKSKLKNVQTIENFSLSGLIYVPKKRKKKPKRKRKRNSNHAHPKPRAMAIGFGLLVATYIHILD